QDWLHRPLEAARRFLQEFSRSRPGCGSSSPALRLQGCANRPIFKVLSVSSRGHWMSADNDNGRFQVIFSPEEIATRIDALAARIAEQNLERLLVVAILKGSFVFAADLIRALHKVGLEPEVDFISLSSYRKSTQS